MQIVMTTPYPFPSFPKITLLARVRHVSPQFAQPPHPRLQCWEIVGALTKRSVFFGRVTCSLNEEHPNIAIRGGGGV